MKIDLYHFKTIDSTNTWAKNECERFKRDHITVVTAQGQTAGHGRHNRRWVSPDDRNVYCTFCFFAAESRRDIANTGQVVSLAVAALLNEMHFHVRLKWPNDLLLNGKKVGGILSEAKAFPPQMAVISGVGVNVNMEPKQLAEVDQPATSLLVEGGSPLEVQRVTEMIIQAAGAALHQFLLDGFSPFLANYRRYLAHTPGDIMQLRDGSRVITGRFVGIDDDGALQLKLADGTVASMFAGELISKSR